MHFVLEHKFEEEWGRPAEQQPTLAMVRPSRLDGMGGPPRWWTVQIAIESPSSRQTIFHQLKLNGSAYEGHDIQGETMS